MIYLFNATEKITADINEICRYLGFKGNLPDFDMMKIINEVKTKIEDAADFKLCYTKKNINRQTFDFGIGTVNSENLKKNLKNCDSVYIFAATAGIEIDRIIRRYSALSPAKAVIAQAVGTTLVESFCDCFCKSVAKEEEKSNFYLRPRFSPGYGDFDISCQKDILHVLNAPKLTGITLTDSLLMIPSKSVTAVMGISKTNSRCALSGCENCDKTTCDFRRNRHKIKAE